MNPELKRILTTGAEALVAGTVTILIMQPHRLVLLRSQALHLALVAARRAAVAAGTLSLNLEAAYHRSTDH